MTAAQVVLGCDDLRLTYGETTALAGVSAVVAPAEVVAITGPSGSGKSSLLYCLACLVPPTSGTVTLHGRDVSTGSPEGRARTRREAFGFVFQFADLVAELTLAENISLPLLLQGTRKAEVGPRVREVMSVMGINDLAGKRPRQVSGGQAQRAAVARALVHRPAVLFADEPTGSLDSSNGEVVFESLVRLARDFASAVVLVTHDDELARRADRRISIRDGRLVEAPA